MTAVVDRPELAGNSANDAATAEKVGYGKPPVSGRFQPGKSGNPKGRPRKDKTAMASLDHVLATEFMITGLDGKPKVVTAQEALWEKLVIDGIKGDRSARQELLKHRSDVLTTNVRSKSKQNSIEKLGFRRVIDALSTPCKLEIREVARTLAREDAERKAELQ